MIGLIERFRDRLPVGPTTPIVSLGEGSTPLLHAPRLGAELGVELYLKLEGAEPDRLVQGSRHDARALEGRSRTARSRSSAPRRATPRPRRPPTRRARACAARSSSRAGEWRSASSRRRRPAARASCAIDGSFDDALTARARARRRHPITLVNNLNPYRLEGQKTAAFEIVDELGDAPDWLCLPVGNGGNITAYWRGFRDSLQRGDATTPPRLLGCQAAGAAPLVSGVDRRAPRDDRDRDPHRPPGALPGGEGGAAPSRRATAVAVTDEEILAAFKRLPESEGVFCEPASAASARRARAGARAGPRRGRRARRLRAHRPRPQGSRHGGRADRRADRGRARLRGGRGRRARRLTVREPLT